jgi:hypothetical protein
MKIKQLIRKMGVILMTLSASMGLASCSPSFNRAKLTDKLLYEKYKQEFTTVMVGGSSISTNTFEAYSHLNLNPEIKIKSFVDKDGESIEDDFNNAIVKNEITQYMKQGLGRSSFNYEVITLSLFYPSIVESSDITYDSWHEINSDIDYDVLIFIPNDDESNENIKSIYMNIVSFIEKYSNFLGRFKVYLLDVKSYDEITQRVNEAYFFDTPFYDMFRHAETFELDIKNGSIDKTIDEFLISKNED